MSNLKSTKHDQSGIDPSLLTGDSVFILKVTIRPDGTGADANIALNTAWFETANRRSRGSVFVAAAVALHEISTAMSREPDARPQ